MIDIAKLRQSHAIGLLHRLLDSAASISPTCTWIGIPFNVCGNLKGLYSWHVKPLAQRKTSRVIRCMAVQSRSTLERRRIPLTNYGRFLYSRLQRANAPGRLHNTEALKIALPTHRIHLMQHWQSTSQKTYQSKFLVLFDKDTWLQNSNSLIAEDISKRSNFDSLAAQVSYTSSVHGIDFYSHWYRGLKVA